MVSFRPSSLLLLLLTVSSSNAFQSAIFPRQQKSHSPLSKLAVVGPEHVNDIHALLNSPAWTHLADASAATADLAVDAATDAAAAANDGGWWQSYLNIFTTTLSAIHDTIDEPLKEMGITQTWGVSIALFTASVRSLLIPLSLQQSKSAEYVKALKPYMSEIKEKFKDNKDAQNRAIAKLYEDANQNPLGGCLFSLAQIPVFLGLYRGIRNLAQEGKLDEPFLWIPSLQGPVTAETQYRGLDWLTSGWVDGHPAMGWETTLAFLVMPVLLVLGQSLSMSVLTPAPDDSMGEEERESVEKSQRILKFLPLLIGFFSLQVPAGLTIYWFTSNFFTLAQSLTVRAYYSANPPDIELPDYWDALDDLDTMTADEKRAAAQAGLAVGPKWEDVVAEAKFHVVVERPPLRTESPKSKKVPAELADWVALSSTTSSSSSSSPNGSSSHHAASPKEKDTTPTKEDSSKSPITSAA